jgi:hypothetical protein
LQQRIRKSAHQERRSAKDLMIDKDVMIDDVTRFGSFRAADGTATVDSKIERSIANAIRQD